MVVAVQALARGERIIASTCSATSSEQYSGTFVTGIPALGRDVDGDVVGADAVAADDAQPRAVATTAGVTCAKHVRIASQSGHKPDELRLRSPSVPPTTSAPTSSSTPALDRRVGPREVGDEDAMFSQRASHNGGQDRVVPQLLLDAQQLVVLREALGLGH